MTETGSDVCMGVMSLYGQTSLKAWVLLDPSMFVKRSHVGTAVMRSELTFERGGTVVITRVKSGEANVFAEGRSPSALPSFIGKLVPMVTPCPFAQK